MRSEPDQFHPVLMFSLIGDQVHQQWVNPKGEVQWRLMRPLPEPDRPPCVTGYVADEDEDNGDATA
jgi:hypothetical protein